VRGKRKVSQKKYSRYILRGGGKRISQGQRTRRKGKCGQTKKNRFFGKKKKNTNIRKKKMIGGSRGSSEIVKNGQQ